MDFGLGMRGWGWEL